jgi:hypothetical protein
MELFEIAGDFIALASPRRLYAEPVGKAGPRPSRPISSEWRRSWPLSPSKLNDRT